MKKIEKKETRIQRANVKEEIIFPLPDKLVNLPASYQTFIEEIKINIKKARQQTIISANSDMRKFAHNYPDFKIVQRVVA